MVTFIVLYPFTEGSNPGNSTTVPESGFKSAIVFVPENVLLPEIVMFTTMFVSVS